MGKGKRVRSIDFALKINPSIPRPDKPIPKIPLAAFLSILPVFFANFPNAFVIFVKSFVTFIKPFVTFVKPFITFVVHIVNFYALKVIFVTPKVTFGVHFVYFVSDFGVALLDGTGKGGRKITCVVGFAARWGYRGDWVAGEVGNVDWDVMLAFYP